MHMYMYMYMHMCMCMHTYMYIYMCMCICISRAFFFLLVFSPDFFYLRCLLHPARSARICQVWFLAAADSKALFPAEDSGSREDGGGGGGGGGVGGNEGNGQSKRKTTVTMVESWHYFLRMMGGEYEAVSQKAKLEETLLSSSSGAATQGAGGEGMDEDERGDTALLQAQVIVNQLQELRAGWVKDLLGVREIEDGAVMVANLVDESVDREQVRAELDAVAGEVRARLDASGSSAGSEGASSGERSAETIEAMNAVLFEARGLKGDVSDYYNAQNSLIHKVLERRKGNPITLSVIYMAVARRLGVTINGINAPRHFLVRVEDPVEREFVDCFAGGTLRSREEAVDLLLGGLAEASEIPQSSLGAFEEAREQARVKIRRILATTISPVEVCVCVYCMCVCVCVCVCVCIICMYICVVWVCICVLCVYI